MTDGSSNEIKILLFGRTGNGKSSVGNSILGRREFTPHSTSSSSTMDIKVAMSTITGIPVIVVDGPSIRDTSTETTEDGQSMIALVKEALSMISNKFHALLVVLKYGIRFTNQEKEAVRMIKAILGDDVIKNYGIIVMTHGDNFDVDVEDEGLTFDNWCDQQTGDIHDLFDECDKRHILFDNRSKDPEKKAKQNEQLLKLILDIQKNRQPYSEDDFQKAEPGQRKLIVKRKLNDLNTQTDTFLSVITNRLNQLKKQEPTVIINDIQKISSKLDEYKEWLQNEDEGTGSIGNLLQRISILETNIRTVTDINNRKVEYMRELALQETVGKKGSKNPHSDKSSKAENNNSKRWWLSALKLGSGCSVIAIIIKYLYGLLPIPPTSVPDIIIQQVEVAKSTSLSNCLETLPNWLEAFSNWMEVWAELNNPFL